MKSWRQDDYIKAYRFAAHAHNRQKFPGTDLPYIMHVSFVAMEIIAALQSNDGYDANLAVQCALLHDVIEDTRTTYEQVEGTFGKPVADGVLALSKNKKLEKSTQMEDSLRRIKQQPREVWMVKLADRITNLQRPPWFWPKAKIKDYGEEALVIYSALGEANEALAQRLLLKIEDYKAYIK